MSTVTSSMARSFRSRGSLSARKMLRGSREPRRAMAWPMPPPGLRWDRWVTSAWRELALHLRIAWVGLWRGLKSGLGVIGVGRLTATVFRADGRVERLGLIATRLVTDAGVAFLVDDWDNNGADLTTLNFHGCGTGTGSEAASDTALGTESTTALNPDSTRATGTRSQPAANQYRTVGTLTFDASAAITEHGIFSQAATGGGNLWDRSVFSAINVASGDSIQFTYTLTLSSGG
jgi:hypothetical protein